MSLVFLVPSSVVEFSFSDFYFLSFFCVPVPAAPWFAEIFFGFKLCRWVLIEGKGPSNLLARVRGARNGARVYVRRRDCL